MKKTSFLLIMAMPLLLSSCGTDNTPYVPKTVDNGVKGALTDCKERVDLINTAVSDLSINEAMDGPSKRGLKKNAPGTKNVDYYDISKTEFTLKQNFGLYVLNNVYHAVNYGYDSENVDKGILVYDEVQNEFDLQLRTTAKENNEYSKFYMQLDQVENSYYFEVDWLTNTQYRGDIYCNGRITYEGDKIANYELKCLTDYFDGWAFFTYFDFIEDKFYLFCGSSNNGGTNGLNSFADELNDGKVTPDNYHKYNFKYTHVATGNITDNAEELNFRGFDIRQNELADEVKEMFKEVLDKSSLTMKNYRHKLKYNAATRVHFMDEALAYGLDKTIIFFANKDGNPYDYWVGVQILYLDNTVNTFVDAVNKMEEGDVVLFNKVKDLLIENNVKNLDEGFENDEVSIKMVKTDYKYFRLNTYQMTSMMYVIKDKVNNKEYRFFIKDGEIIGEHKFSDKTILKTEFVDEKIERYDYEGGFYNIFKTETYYNYAHCDLCDDLALISKTEKWYNYDVFPNMPEREPYYQYNGKQTTEMYYSDGIYQNAVSLESITRGSGNGEMTFKHGEIELTTDWYTPQTKTTTIGKITTSLPINTYEGYGYNYTYKADYYNDESRSFTFEESMNVTKIDNMTSTSGKGAKDAEEEMEPTSRYTYILTFIRNYQYQGGNINTKEEFVYDMMAYGSLLRPSLETVLSSYKIEVEVPESVKEYYKENDIERYRDLYQECVYTYDFDKHEVTTSTHNYMDKDSDPVVETLPYEEAFIIPLYLDLGYDIYDYGSFDIYAKTRYQETVEKILNGQIYTV